MLTETDALYSSRLFSTTDDDIELDVDLGVVTGRQGAAANLSRRWLLSLLCLVLILGVTGCPSKPSDDQLKSKTTAADPANQNRPAVPLRVWFVGDEAAAPIIQRQWLASYDRPLELTMQTAEQLLQHKSCDCDVIIYPAMLLGELVARDWLAELPQRLQPSAKSSDADAFANTSGSRRDGNMKPEADAPLEPQPAAWQEQSKYGRRVWGLSLSVSMPVVLANFSLPERATRRENEAVTIEDSQAYWQAIVDALARARQNTPANTDAPSKQNNGDSLDALATCDRFLLIATSLAASDSRIGLLLDPQSMTPRLNEPAFEEAAAVLNRLKAAGASLDALAGSHRMAWQALSGQSPDVTISVPPAADEDVDKITHIVSLQPVDNPARAGSRTSSGWNSGQGLIVSLARDCRQSSVSIDFARWLTSDSTRTVFAKRVNGFTAESAYAPSSSAWQAQRLNQRLAQQSRVQSEPRLPDAWRLRMTLGEELIAMLRGEKDATTALSAATAKWNEIIKQRGQKVLQPAYEQSLGLSN